LQTQSLPTQTGAKWIGIVGSLGCALLSFCLCLAGHNLLGLLLCLAAAPFYVSLICAQMRRQPRLYWPFLLANVRSTNFTNKFALKK
jgi:hypothetical protein